MSRKQSTVRELRLEPKLASVEFARVAVTDLWTEDSGPIEKMIEKAASGARANGAGCLVLGCMSMAFRLVGRDLSRVPLPVINPLSTAIKTAETFVDLKIGHSRVTYPAADFEKLNQTVFGRIQSK